MKTWGKRGRRARLTPLVALIMLAILHVVAVFFLLCGYFMCLWVLYMGRIHKGSKADKGFVIFFPPPDLLYPVDIVLRILLKQPSTETQQSGEEWGVCSPSSQCEAEPITRHNARFWETLGCF